MIVYSVLIFMRKPMLTVSSIVVTAPFLDEEKKNNL